MWQALVYIQIRLNRNAAIGNDEFLKVIIKALEYVRLQLNVFIRGNFFGSKLIGFMAKQKAPIRRLESIVPT